MLVIIVSIYYQLIRRPPIGGHDFLVSGGEPSLIQLLNALDLLVDAFYRLLERPTPIDGREQTWLEWVQSQWWSPPLIIAGVVF